MRSSWPGGGPGGSLPTMPLHLTQAERDLLAGGSGDATALAMRVVTSAAELLGAESLVEIDRKSVV